MKTNLVVMAVTVLMGCSVSTHAVKPSALGTASSAEKLMAVIDQPGELTVETVNSADWVVDRSGLINLKSDAARDAGLVDGDEAIQVYFHVIRHPTKGTFIVDTGIEKALRDDPSNAALRGIVASFAHTDKMKVHEALGDFVKKEGRLDGVLLTHLHLDHIAGMPDVPHGTPIYSGAGETASSAAMNMATQGTTDREFEGQESISEWQFQADPSGRFEGVIDVFGDGSLWAIKVPGHTVGSTAYVARTTSGPVLMTGDTCHTAWGWQHDVEPGTFTADQAANKKSLDALEKLAAEHPAMSVRLGHQSLPQ